MSIIKRMIVVLLAITMMTPAAAFAASSPQTTSLKDLDIAHADEIYYSKGNKVSTLFKDASHARIRVGEDFVITKIVKNGKTVKKIKGAGNYKITVKGIGKYTGTATFTMKIKKASSKLKVKVSKKTYKAKTLKKKARTFRIGAKSLTKKSYKVLGNKYAKKHIKVSKKGKVKIAKNTKKGTYKIRVTSRATNNYKKTTKTIVIKVK